MKLRYFVLVTLIAASITACADSPTASKTRSTTKAMATEADTTARTGGTYGSGH